MNAQGLAATGKEDQMKKMKEVATSPLQYRVSQTRKRRGPKKIKTCKEHGHDWIVGYGFTGGSTEFYFGGYFVCDRGCGKWFPILEDGEYRKVG